MDWSGSPVTQRFPCAAARSARDEVLRVVGVLVFVHEDVEEAAAESFPRFRDVAQQPHHEDQQVVEVRRVGAASRRS